MKKIFVLATLVLAFVLTACSPVPPKAAPATIAPTTAPVSAAPNPTAAPTETGTPSGPAPWSLVAVGD